MSDDDECWRARVDYSRPEKLAEADANMWARIVVVTAVARLNPGQPAAEQAQAAPPAATPPPATPSAATPPAATPRADARSNRPERVEPPAAISRVSEPPARAVPGTPAARPVAVSQRPEPSPVRTTVSNNAATSGLGHGPTDSGSALPVRNDENVGNVARGATAPPPATAVGLVPAPRLTYARILDGALAAIRAGRNAEAGELIDQLIEADPARSEGWALRGGMAMTVYNNLPVAYRVVPERALARRRGRVPAAARSRLEPGAVRWNLDGHARLDSVRRWGGRPSLPVAACGHPGSGNQRVLWIGVRHVPHQGADARRGEKLQFRRRASKRRTGRQPPGGRRHAAANRESATVARRPVNEAAVNGTSA